MSFINTLHKFIHIAGYAEAMRAARRTIHLTAMAFIIVLGLALTALAERGIQAGASPTGSGARRVALIIGNSEYTKERLRNPANDARDMARVLKVLGFNTSLHLNLNQRKMEAAIYRFGKQLPKGGVALFYYAGHGVQVDGRNYLIPLGKEIRDAADMKYDAVDAGRIVDRMERAQARLNIMILDACRDNPFRGLRSGSQGLAAMTGGSGTIIAFATSPGSSAADGSGRNGVYTEALVRNLTKPGLTVEEVLKHTAAAVQRQRSNQVPWFTSSFTGTFYFKPDKSKPQKPIQLAYAPGPEEGEMERRKLRIKSLLRQAWSLYNANSLTTPSGASAYDTYKKVLKLDPLNANARKGLKLIAYTYVDWAEQRIKAGDFAKAEKFLASAEKVREGDERVLVLRDKLRAAIEKAEQAQPDRLESSADTHAQSPRPSKKGIKTSTEKLVYVVKRGDSLFTIAQRYRVRTSDIRRWNRMRKSDTLTEDMRLTIFYTTESESSQDKSTTDASAQSIPQSNQQEATKRVTTEKLVYVVKRGDTLFTIAQRYRVRTSDLRRWNRMTRKDPIRAGQRLTIYITKPTD